MSDIAQRAGEIAREAAALAERAHALSIKAAAAAQPVAEVAEPFLFLLTIFLLACFVGYYVVWNVTPALHSPLMGVTNAISSVIVVGGLLAVGLAEDTIARVFGFLAVLLASVNIFGGFLVTHRMLSMFRKKGS
ncbi:proton-translocating transhydrogenase family protein [Elioraea tepidiphila]|jgi:NAD(P) transhydrogenase subunit alpha|uniref:proton-translocating transhydrogenase family protein n=1 Tax=Elioraea tepidiphila TaxID=457934 RepID=UPI00036615C3|nr:proton-translocating transhydrogenase family protein [Elioraea tepidiphila]